MRREAAVTVAAHRRPLTFALGAGASFSSGGPTTRAVHERLSERLGGRLESLVRERLHNVVDEDVRDSLRPLFQEIRPNVGYRLLAALSRQRRINIINLNWDDAAEQAGEIAGVPCSAFDPLSGKSLQEAESALPLNKGMLIAHVHGTIGSRPRYSILETLPNNPELGESVHTLLEHTTFVCGASLAGDLDVAHVLQEMQGRSLASPAVWLFARPAAERGPVEPPSSWIEVVSHDTDFDALSTALAEECWADHGLKDARWQELVRRLPHLDLPDDALVELAHRERRGLLDAQVAALVGWPQVGKTVSALRLAHLRMLMEAPHMELRISSDIQDSVTELAIASKRSDVVLFVDDPFGQSLPSINPRVVDFLRALADGSGSYAYVASRNANWNRAAGRLLRPYRGLAVATRHSERWFEHKELLRLADTTERPTAARRAIHNATATTPPDVLEAGRLGRVLSFKERITDGESLLEGDPELALCCVLVRLQELRSSPIRDAELSAILGCEPTCIDGYDALLNDYELDAGRYWAFAHPTAREVADAHLMKHHEAIERRLLAAPVVPSWVRRTIDGWRLQRGLLDPADCASGAEEPTPADWLAERLASAPSDGLLREIADLSLDQWSTIELAYELIRIWDDVRDLPNADLLLQQLLEREMGAYAVLEGCLYFQLGADDELWSRVSSRLWKLQRDQARVFERLLSLDAVLWRPPSDDAVTKWANRTIAELDSGAPEFAFVRFAAGYHPAGLTSLSADRVLRTDAEHEWTPEQAELGADLVAWHFAHQSRARAMLHRYTHHEKQWLCQSLFVGEPSTEDRAALRLARSLIARETTAGWGFHLICNLAAVAGLNLRSEEARELAAQALELAPAGDPGVISAVLAYASADTFRKALRRRATERNEADWYREALALGVERGTIVVGPPRFRFIHDPLQVLTTVDLRSRNLPPAFAGEPPAKLAERLWLSAPEVMARCSLGQRREVARRIGRVERGDLRPLAIVARGSTISVDPFVDILERWRRSIPSDEPDKLFE